MSDLGAEDMFDPFKEAKEAVGLARKSLGDCLKKTIFVTLRKWLRSVLVRNDKFNEELER